MAIDQPSGTCQAAEVLAAGRNPQHDAHDELMECLGQMLCASQRSGLPPDGQSHIEAVRRRVST